MKSDSRSSIVLIAPAIAGTLIAFLVYVLPLPTEMPQVTYMPFHVLLAIINSVIDILIFFLAWNSLKRELTGYTLLLACAFLGVALTEITHVVVHTGLPGLLSSYAFNQITYFTLFSRALVAIALNIAAFGFWPDAVPKRLKYLLPGLTLAIIGCIEFIGARYIQYIPQLFVEGIGATLIKRGFDGMLSLFFLLAAFGSLRRSNVKNGTDFRLLCIASVLLAISEICIATPGFLYSKLHILGHIYNAISYWIIFRAIFVSNFETPFLKLERSEKALREAVKTRDEFLTVAGHELRTPLTPLRAQFQLIQMQLERVQTGKQTDHSSLLKYTKNIENNLERLTRLINNLIDVAAVRSGQPLLLKPRLCSLDEIIKNFLARHASELRESQTSVGLELQEAVEGYWDPLRIEQLLSNLLSNSIKYARGAPIRIRLEKSGETVRLLYEDLGGGIPKEKLDGMVAPGLGVGLFMVRKIIEAHEGEIHVKSEKGKWTRFLLVFPLKRAEASPSKKIA
jgi:signal transduction histidine kinase